MKRTPLFIASIVALGVAACGGGNKKEQTTPPPTGDGDGEATPPPRGDNSAMVPADKMEEIPRVLDRKRQIVSRCLAIAVDNRELPKSTHGKITLEFVISPAGKAQDIKIIKADFESKSVQDCVIRHVTDAQFPDLPKPVPWSYSFAFEAN
jgi:hypothetical protein